MAKIEPFEKHTDRYEEWFEEHRELYRWELKAIERLLPAFSEGVEIGIGTGRFALPLGIRLGIEPSPKMAARAMEKGLEVIPGTAEEIPLPDESVDFALIVTTICFVDDPRKALREIRRILRPGGWVIVGFVDRDTPLGRYYLEHRNESRFYAPATFFSAKEVAGLLREAGFGELEAVQTLFGEGLESMEGGVRPGWGEGAFVVIRGRKVENQERTE
ncbi:MAG TPA: class I SAM-dependent methyltransferase [Nitratifractor salsuginis]|uniref:Class I SAM-dependent methyltransferase n=1 Tax=Nitratifractor salsuginis TaxID=269261 RepID=A0A7V2WLK6_9BACT|nr:class I SAM-dependent methyltransferase [Nitratifractor salsuginis]